MTSTGKNIHDDTILAHAGRRPHKNKGVVNPPVYHASTILYPTLHDLENAGEKKVRYGRYGTPTTFSLEEALCELEKGDGTVLTPSGLSAIAVTFTALTKSGDHVLVTDNTYGPTRAFLDNVHSQFGIEVEYFDPLEGAAIAERIRPETSLIWLESPGSQTFEMTDVPAIVAVAKDKGIHTALDNSWGAGYFYKPIVHGVDVSVQAATKYIVGHSDAMLGAITCAASVHAKVRRTAQLLGICAGPDDVYLGQRGIRTLATRLRQHHENGLKMATWLQARPEVKRVLHPALPDDPGHAIWKRDFTGACGLFGFILEPVEKPALAAMLDQLSFFGMGYSWGGYESLLIPTHPEAIRTASNWEPEGISMRIHVGLEDLGDLQTDLDAGFARMAAAS